MCVLLLLRALLVYLSSVSMSLGHNFHHFLGLFFKVLLELFFELFIEEIVFQFFRFLDKEVLFHQRIHVGFWEINTLARALRVSLAVFSAPLILLRFIDCAQKTPPTCIPP